MAEIDDTHTPEQQIEVLGTDWMAMSEIKELEDRLDTLSTDFELHRRAH